MPLFGLRFTAQDEDERAQKNTFTRWINLHLEEHSSSGRVNDLFEDIRDGVLLCHLIEVLTGEALEIKTVDDGVLVLRGEESSQYELSE
ncbi:hypothetical protein NECAME_01729 [Necator americanus]|uniref:Calponin-homology (CH) domain-containing protein n=1 Tax=Necator americanus TaxID=51031 RepID=W2TS42_NECAM|nr:hypothetical protein NECAME_01729 [Necator americanus]ETN83936.1 hypothetical protein NECAME_01729 [Necator americanus]